MCVAVCVCVAAYIHGFSFFLKKRAAGSVRKSVGGDNSLGMGGCNDSPHPTPKHTHTPLLSLLKLTRSKGRVYNLLPTTCTVGSEKTSFQEGRPETEKSASE